MSSFALVIEGAPISSQAALTAFHFANAVLAKGHVIQRLFFYQDGVHNASALSSTPQDEFNLPLAWQALIRQHGLDAVVCISSAVRRGIVNAQEAERHGLPASNLLEGFVIGGLGQLMESTRVADRVVRFPR